MCAFPCAGDCALASGFVSYLGPFNKEFRELLINRDFLGDCQKLKIPVTEGMQVCARMYVRFSAIARSWGSP